jgi:hypothetical protein
VQKKAEIYKWIKISGMVSFIPLVLAAGIFSGYFLGDILVKKFSFPAFTVFLSVMMGTLVSAVQTVRIVRLAFKSEKHDQ